MKDNKLKLISLGYDNAVIADRVIAVVGSNTAPIKRLINEARKDNMLIDATNGRKTRTVIITDSKHVILTSVLPETIAERVR